MRRFFVSITKVALALVGMLLVTGHASAKLTDPIQLSVMSLKAKADLGTVTFTYSFKSTNRSESVGLQIYAHRTGDNGESDWPMISAADSTGATYVVQLYKGLTATGTFTAKLNAGTYGQYRLLFFDAPDGHNPDWGKEVYDSAEDKQWPDANLHLTVTTSQVRITDPTLVMSHAHVEADGTGTYTVKIPGAVEIPAAYTGTDQGFWAMAKGSGGFNQVWAAMPNAMGSGDPLDPYRVIPIVFELDKVKSGIWNVNFGLFHPNFGDPIQWLWPGLDFEVGGDAWETKAPSDSLPPRVHVKNRKFVTDDGKVYDFYPDQPDAMHVGFIRGGNYGNTIARDIFPKLDTPGFFVNLHEAGCRFIRVNFNPDRYPDDLLYQHAVDQVVQNIWAAGLYPLLTPQDLPTGKTDTERADKGVRVVEAVAQKYKGQPVWIEVCNEPHEFTTWAAWKPIAVRYVDAIRAIDPGAFVVVPFEGYSKDGEAAAADPITSTSVDLYDGHAYVDPDQVAALFGSAGKAGLPVLIGEYGGGPGYLRKLDRAFQTEGRALMAVSPWAFTVKGQDMLPLVDEGDTAVLKFTDSGQVIANDFNHWNKGEPIATE